MIFLVLSMHAADTYSTLGNWYYRDGGPIGRVGVLGFWTYQAFLQAFFMGLLFFIAGYFAPGSYDRKGFRRFLFDRWKRLGLPTLFYVFILGPLTEYYISGSWQPNPRISFLHEWTIYIVRLRFPGGTGPMWFCAALLIFSAVYAVMRQILPEPTEAGAESQAPTDRAVVNFILAISAATFCVRLVYGSNRSFYNMHLADFSQYVLLFGAGILAYRHGWLERIPTALGIRWLAISLGLGSVLWAILLEFGGVLQHDFSRYGGGLYWQSAVMNMWESLVCVGVSLGLLVLFRDHYNTQGRAAKFLSENAFAVYLFHPPILIAIALALHPLSLPLIAKFAMLTILSAMASFVLSAMVFRRTPLLRHIL